MIVSLKLLLGLVFVLTGGAVFTDWGRKHRTLVISAAVVSVIGSYYLFKDLYDDFKREIVLEISSSQTTSLPVNDAPNISGGSPELNEPVTQSPQPSIALVKLDGRWNGWSYAKDSTGYGVITHTRFKFKKRISFPQYDTPAVKIYSMPTSEWVVIVGQDIDGKETSYHINTKTGDAIFARDDAKNVYWSPSGRYVLSVGGGEVDFLGLVDVTTGLYSRSDSLQYSHNNSNRALFVNGAPLWARGEEFFIVTVHEIQTDDGGREKSGTLGDAGVLRVEVPSLATRRIRKPDW